MQGPPASGNSWGLRKHDVANLNGLAREEIENVMEGNGIFWNFAGC